MWRRYVEDELWNRDNPSARPRTQRRYKRGDDEGLEAKTGGRRPRAQVMEPLSSQGLDRAYQREYLEAGEPKRQRHETPALKG